MSPPASSCPRVRPLLLLVLMAAIGGCSGGVQDDSVNLPVTPVIAARPRWAVASEVYVRVREEPAADAAIEGHLRTGDVVEIVTISTVLAGDQGGGEIWYEVSGAGITGWTLGSGLEFYASRTRALNAATGNRHAVPTEDP